MMIAVSTFASIPTIAHAENHKQLPPAGIEVDAEVLKELDGRCTELQQRLDGAVKTSPDADTWRPDVRVLIRAVRLAIDQNLFFKKNEPAAATKLLNEAERRLAAAQEGERGLALLATGPTTADEPRLLVGGFVSSIDDSVQPYGLVVPSDYDANATPAIRMDVWLHGRGDAKVEVAFLNERMNKVGQYAPANTIVLHPFGRHCNAFKFAGETDVYESIDHVSKLIDVDPQRIAIRGFSMGGAGVWHLAVHDPARWFAANPGAGFVDTIVYQGWADKMPYEMSDAQRKLMQWYDVLPWVGNFQNTRLIAYSGEVDKQRQAAERVYDRCQELGMEWPHVIGKDMGHKIDSDSREKIDATLQQWAVAEISQPRPKIDFTTYTLHYAKADWISIDGMTEHWTRANVKATVASKNTLIIDTEGVTHLKLDFSATPWPAEGEEVGLTINGEKFYIADENEDTAGIQCTLGFEDGMWWQIENKESQSLRKRPGLQGPIDDAFCEKFLFVVPTRPTAHGVVQRWVNRELAYAKTRWERLMRGRVNVVRDVDVTEDQIKNCHLICFGDFGSNRFLHKIAAGLPVKWSRSELTVGDQEFDPSTHVPVFCYPNPQNPDRYVVINSGMTFRDFSNLSNSRQIAMLPDWAVLSLEDSSQDEIIAGDVAAEGFFDEQWQLK